MKTVALILLLISLSFASENIKKTAYFNYAVNDQMVKSIREKASTWEAYEPDENPLRHYSDKELKYLLSMPGVDYKKYSKELEKGFKKMKRPTNKNKVDINSPLKAITLNLPTNFDWRTTDTGQRCMPKVLNQGTCGACYAFTTATVFAARYCSLNPSEVATEYSPQDVLACNVRTEACNGGILDFSFNYLEEYGITTLACQPYAESHTSTTSKFPSQKCLATKCASGQTLTKKFCKKGTTVIIQGKDRIKYEIMTRGPVGTFMTTYDDLTNYKSGIYKHESGSEVGGHAVVLVGWGVENGKEYWVVMNSWGESWGMQGYFFIDMTDTDSDIAKAGYFCLPETT